MRADRPGDKEVLLEGRGAVDLEEQTGRSEVDLSGLFGGLAGAEAFSRPFELRWDASRLYAEVDGRAQTRPRGSARRNGGLIGRLPDEPDALVRWLSSGRDARFDGHDDAVRFRVPAATDETDEPAVAGGIPLRRVEFTVTVDGDGRPAVVAYSFTQPRVERDGETVLPARTVTVAYDLDDLGGEVDAGLPDG